MTENNMKGSTVKTSIINMIKENLEKSEEDFSNPSLTGGLQGSEPSAWYHGAESVSSEPVMKMEFPVSTSDESSPSVRHTGAGPLIKAEASSECDSNVNHERIQEYKDETAYDDVKLVFPEQVVKEEPPDILGDAALILPDGLCIIENTQDDSTTGTKGVGVWTTQFLPRGTQFGPYPYEAVKDRMCVKPMYPIWTSSLRMNSDRTQCNINIVRIGEELYCRVTADIQQDRELVCSDRLIIQPKKPHQCSECDKAFPHPSHLELHMRIHTGVKPYSCPDCGKQFARPYNLTIHRRTHTGERPYHCAECGRCFAASSDLLKHSRTHTGAKPYICSICGKDFARSNSLQTHILTHSGEKHHKCEICGKCFTQAATLRCHVLAHTGEKPFTCPACGKGFSHPSNLRSHKLRHNNKGRSVDDIMTDTME